MRSTIRIASRWLATSVAAVLLVSSLTAGLAIAADKYDRLTGGSSQPEIDCWEHPLTIDVDDTINNNVHAYKELHDCTAPVNARLYGYLWMLDPNGGPSTLINADSTDYRCNGVTYCYVAVSGSHLPAGTYMIEFTGYWDSAIGDPPGSYFWAHEGTYVTFTRGPSAPAP
ncbi:MAG: hypothetical protein QOH08_1146 [Chloroflexota bacterium]|nr:hypothetical protein [Chloroflexota bacterium]